MLVAMGLAAAACILIGVFPSLLYTHLPFAVDYHPYTPRHITATLGLLVFTAAGFFWLLKQLDPGPTVSLDTDWFYRRGFSAALPVVDGALARLEGFAGQISDLVVQQHLLRASARLRELDARVIDVTMVGIGRLTEALGRGLSLGVSGNAQHYGLIMAAGVLVAIAFAIFAL
jgi:multicomponent Na+:H+ antiporter subunit D